MTVADLPGATLRTAHVSTMDNACYLLMCAATGAQLMIDAADDAPALLSMVSDGGDRLDLVVTTHRHWDHHRALPDVVSSTGARTAAGAEDADELPVPVDDRLSHGDTVVVATRVLRRHPALGVGLAR